MRQLLRDGVSFCPKGNQSPSSLLWEMSLWIIDGYLEHITDEKPICARQCIKLLPLLAEAKPTLAPKIVSALRDADVARYADSMRPLAQKDIRDSLLAIEHSGEVRA